jgi:hypothetical protein
MSESKVAQSVAEALTNPAAAGKRHNQMKSLVLSLIEIGLRDEPIFAQFRSMYSADVPDSEIKRIIAWGRKRATKNANAVQVSPEAISLTPADICEKAKAWLDGFEVDEASLWDASHIRPEDDADPGRDSLLILQHLYHPHELVCINTRFHVTPKKDGIEKVTIIGPGETKTAAQWIEHIKANGTPERRAGAWIRLNPLRSPHGSGSGGAHSDADVAVFRYLLLESDLLEPAIALSVYGKLKLPIAAIIDSAGRGPHAWVTVNAGSAEEFAYHAKDILDCLSTIGFDSGNSNPSRYGRLAGARRSIGARQDSDGFQRLLYVAPHLKAQGIFS